MVDCGEFAEALGQPVRFHRWRRSGVGHKRRNLQPARALLFFGRQHLDIRLFQRIGLIVRHHFAGGAVHQQLARVHRQQVFKLLGFFDISGRHHHRHPCVFGAQIVYQGPKLAARQRIHTGGRLIQNQQIGRMHQRATQAQLLLHAARELAGGAVGKRREAGGGQQPRNSRLARCRVQTIQPRMKVNVFIHAQGGIQILAQTLRHIGDAVRQITAHGFIGHIAAQHRHCALLNDPHPRHQR